MYIRDLGTWFVAAAVTLILPLNAWGALLQILHTNDLHSHFDVAEDRSLEGYEPPHKPTGGYAQVKATIDRLKQEAARSGVESLVVDAGDFSEGTPFFFGDQGEQSWRAINAMGYDAVALGNHDYLMGQADLDRIIGHVQPGFQLVAANFKAKGKYRNIGKYLKPAAELTRAGAKIAIVGLTTDDWVYTWRAGGAISAPQCGLRKVLKKLRSRNDYVILLTHLGVSTDQAMVKNNKGIDLVVGGHTHTFLTEPVWQKDPNGKNVGIVQAGQHGQVVGRLIVDVNPGKPLVIKSYELVDVANDGPKDAAMAQTVEEAHQALNHEFGDQWLHETIGTSEVPLLIPYNGSNAGHTVWGDLVAEALREAVHADLSIDAGGQLFGDNLTGGPITREKLFSFYPRIFGFQEKRGWTVWSLDTHGWELQAILEIAMDQGFVFNLAGASYTAKKEAGLWHLKDFEIGGRKVEALKSYRVALPEGIGRAMAELSPIFKLWFHHQRDSRTPIWTAIEDELARRGGVVRDPTDGMLASLGTGRGQR